MIGYVHSFESLAAVDGEGLRCAVFLSGCPLRCAYCHNPDTWDMGTGKATHAQDLAAKIIRYKPYFGSDGGVTFSGGEPLLQSEFILAVNECLKEQSIRYAIDTSGAVSLSDSVKELLIGAQLVILDLKFWDDESYIKYTGRDMSHTLAMLDYLESIGARVWIRTVVIPEVNDSEDKIKKYTEIIKDKKCVLRYELLPFHTMGFVKYEKLGIKNEFVHKNDLDAEIKERLQHFAEQCLKKV